MIKKLRIKYIFNEKIKQDSYNFLIILLVVFFLFLYFETKKTERLSAEFKENVFSAQQNLKQLSIQKLVSSP